MGKYKAFIAATKTLAPYLSAEVNHLGFKNFTSPGTGIFLEATFQEIMYLNLHSRLAHHVFLLLKEFKCQNPDELYRQIYEIAWENFIFEDGYLSVFSNVSNPTIKDTRFANLKCKDAIVDRLVKTKNKRPDSGPLRDKTVVYLYWKDNDCAVYLDTSGESLAYRNYRKIPLSAPLQETLASGIIAATGWDGKSNFINPMCGSGTLAIEAALIALNRAPSANRENFGFMHTKLFDSLAWKKIKEEARRAEKEKIDCRIIATDINPAAIEASRKNAALAGVENYIEFNECDYSKTEIPQGSGIIVINPGYGLRMGDVAELEKLYEGIGDFFKQKCSGYTGYIFSGNIPLLKKVGLRPKKKISFYNADIECRLYEYPLYAGTKRDFSQKSPGD